MPILSLFWHRYQNIYGQDLKVTLNKALQHSDKTSVRMPEITKLVADFMKYPLTQESLQTHSGLATRNCDPKNALETFFCLFLLITTIEKTLAMQFAVEILQSCTCQLFQKVPSQSGTQLQNKVTRPSPLCVRQAGYSPVLEFLPNSFSVSPWK